MTFLKGLALGLLAGTLFAASAAGAWGLWRAPMGRPMRVLPAAAAILDPASGSWSPAGALKEAREDHAAVLLPDGKVLVLGGTDSESQPRRRAELFDPGTLTFLPAGEWAGGNGWLHPVALPNGEVLVFAEGSLGHEKDAARWTPPSTWTAIPFPGARAVVAAARLPDGRVLLVDGERAWTGDGLGPWKEAGSLRYHSTPTRALLPRAGGALLVPWDAGSKPEEGEAWYPSHLEWTGKTDRWSEDPALAAALRGLDSSQVRIHWAATLDDGRFLFIAAGSGLLWDSVARAAKPLPTLPVEDLFAPSFVMLDHDRLLMAGGPAEGATEVFVLDAGKGAWTRLASLAEPRSRQVFTRLADGRVLMTGGGLLGWRKTGTRVTAILVVLVGASGLLGPGVLLVRRRASVARWLGFAVGVLIPLAIGAGLLVVLAAIGSAIRG